MRYADGTDVPVAKTQTEIMALLRKRGAGTIGQAEERARAVVVFELEDRRIRFTMPLPVRSSREFTRGAREKERSPEAADRLWEQACRAKWRGLLLAIKSKFVNVDNEIESFEEAFLAHIVPPGQGGKTVGELALPAIAEAHRTGSMPPLMLPPGQSQDGGGR